jgi:hypothetical protein
MAEQEVLGLTSVLTEPTKTNHLVDHTQGETSYRKFKAVADSINADLIDIEMNEKRKKLEAIKRPLKDDVSSLARAALEKMLVENGAMQGGGHDLSSEGFQSITSKQNDQKQDTELDELDAWLEEELNGMHEDTLLLFEVAWRLAQVIIIGCVEQSLVRESLSEILQ